jgi:hypothetical protein
MTCRSINSIFVRSEIAEFFLFILSLYVFMFFNVEIILNNNIHIQYLQLSIALSKICLK